MKKDNKQSASLRSLISLLFLVLLAGLASKLIHKEKDDGNILSKIVKPFGVNVAHADVPGGGGGGVFEGGESSSCEGSSSC